MSSNPYETNFSDLNTASDPSSGIDLDTKEAMLFQATAAIRKFRTDQASLRTVMETQRSFWRTIGVLAIVGISIYVVVIFFMLSLTAFSMSF
jgi:CHASE3 domain sensor protein